MLLLGIDLGTSSIKVSVMDAASRKVIAGSSYPDVEVEIISPAAGWAEQSADEWWKNIKQAILRCNATGLYNPAEIGAIGIGYQMHGLVIVDKDQRVLRNAIIWSDSRTVSIGSKAFREIGEEKCLSDLLNSPGTFTASKLAWVRENEPEIYAGIDKVLLPGDFVAMKFTGETTTTTSALSEGVFWNFREERISDAVINYFGFERDFFPAIQPVFSDHGTVTGRVAEELGIKKGTPVTYKAGDQPNNALSLNVLQPGEVASTAGTSGVIYGVSDQLSFDRLSRINSFAHVNDGEDKRRIGVLLCINGAGILNRWVRKLSGSHDSYEEMNIAASRVKPGSDGLVTIPFGNGAERMLNNAMIGAHLQFLDFNIHSLPHVVRSAQEGIAFAFRYGLDIMKENGIEPKVIRAGKANMFLSEVFRKSFVNATGVAVELYQSSGSMGAAIGAGIGAGCFTENDLSAVIHPLERIEPDSVEVYEELYQRWKEILEEHKKQ